MIVGMRLGDFGPSQNQVHRDLSQIILPSLFLKLIIFPSLMLSLAKAFSLSDLMCNALVLQAETPTAISVLLLGEANKKNNQLLLLY